MLVAGCLLLALALSGGAFSRNLLSLRWVDLASQYAMGQNNSAADLAQAEELHGKLTAACASAPAARSARICMFSDMASLIAGELDIAGLQARLAAYPPASLEQATLAGFGGEYFYYREEESVARALWRTYLPEEMLIHRTHTAVTNQDWETAHVLLAAIPDKTYDGLRRATLARVLVEMARQAFFEQDYGRAENYWRRAIKQWPDRPSYYVSLSRALGGQQRWKESALVLEEAIRLRPNYANYYVYKAQALLHGEEFAEASTVALRALELEPDNAAARDILNQMGTNQ